MLVTFPGEEVMLLYNGGRVTLVLLVELPETLVTFPGEEVTLYHGGRRTLVLFGAVELPYPDGAGV